MKSSVKVGLIQHPPVYLNLPESVETAFALVQEAAQEGAGLIVFPETWFPGYPVWLDNADRAARWNDDGAKALYRILTDNALVMGDRYCKKLLALAGEHDLIIVIGCHERIGKTLYNSMLFLDGNRKTIDVHRKLMPTYNEKLIWGAGDGSTLPVLEAGPGRIGGLICWEHWMPLARAAMHAKNETIHIAQWPSVIELHQIASRTYAFEGGCFVLACGTVLNLQDALDGLESLGTDEPAARDMLQSISPQKETVLMSGGSCVIGPDAGFVAPPVFNEKTIIYECLDFEKIKEMGLLMDTAGHYSRPDVFSLSVDIKSKQNVAFL